MELGQRIRDARQAVGLSQGQACYGICDRTYLSKIENGVLIPPADLLRLLAERLRAHDLTISLAASRLEARHRARLWLHRSRLLPPDGATWFAEGYRHWWAVREPNAPAEFHALTARLLGGTPAAIRIERVQVSHWLAEAYRFYRWRPYQDYQLQIGLERLGQHADRHRFGQVDLEGQELLSHLAAGPDRAVVAAALVPVTLARRGGAAAIRLCQDAGPGPWWMDALIAGLGRLGTEGPTGRPLSASLRAAARPLAEALRPSAWRRDHRSDYGDLLLVLQRMARLSGAPAAARHLERVRQRAKASTPYGDGVKGVDGLDSALGREGSR